MTLKDLALSVSLCLCVEEYLLELHQLHSQNKAG